MINEVIGGAAGMVLGAMLIGGRDECVAALRALLPLPTRWGAPVAGALTGSGIAMLIASAWLLHGLSI